jgi:xanthine/uracil/vitamin C permease (AzgA family)
MRGPGLFSRVIVLLLCGVCLAQRVQFTPAEKSLVLERMKSIPETNAERATRLKELFIQAGCNGNSLFEQKVESAETPNIVCRLGTGEGDTVIVGGHYERTSSPIKMAASALFVLMTVLRLRQWVVEAVPVHLVSFPPGLGPILWQLDFRGVMMWSAFPIVLTIFIMAFVDTMGTLIGLSARAGFLDKDGNLPQIERPMLVDALTTCLAPAVGTTTSGAYVESATGIESGGRTGLTALVTAGCFALTLFFAPFVTSIPPQAYGPALIIVGLFMLEPITRIDFSDYSESIPAFAVVTLMCFTFNIAVGISAGFILYPLSKLVAGKIRQVKPALFVLTGLSLLFFIFYPYG